MNIIKSITKCFNSMSSIGKILFLLLIFLLIVVTLRKLERKTEGLTQQQQYLFKNGNAIYDDFYADAYDHLVYNQIKNDYEIGTIINSEHPTKHSVIADIGCGTGHHVASLSNSDMEVIGIDISPAMIQKAKENYPALKDSFRVGDALNGNEFAYNSLTDILCMYFTIYYIEDKQLFLRNCYNWLRPGGLLVLHVVNKDKFDPILPPGNPLYIVSPQKYAKKRITSTKITFNDFTYSANFDLPSNSSVAKFEETFKFNDGKKRKNEHILYMEDIATISNMAQNVGFTIHSKIDLVNCAYEYQYLYVFMKV